MICMTLAGGHWYTSSGFWSPASAVLVTLLTCVAGVMVAVRVGHPKLRITYALTDITPLLATQVPGLKVMHGDVTLTHPYVARLVVRNDGRRDISRGLFDGGDPLRFDVGTPIVERLELSVQPPDQPEPHVTWSGSVPAIDPVKIGRGEVISIAVLVDGDAPGLRPPVQALTDVRLRPAPAVSVVHCRRCRGAGISVAGCYSLPGRPGRH